MGMATKSEVNSNDLVIIPPVNNINDYTFVKNLGNGAQGVVNHYRQKSNNASYAIKEAKMASIGKKSQKGIKREADLLTIPPPHPNIVQCFGSWLDYNTNTFYTKEEYLEGMDLFEYYQANFTNIPEDELLSIIKGSLSGIAHLHKHNVWHRDLKLENIFRTNSGTIKLFDLGLGKCTSSEFTKSLVGTPLYYSPEEVDLGYKRNALGYTKKSDLHPLAVIYSIFATKYHLFEASTQTKSYANICNKPLQLQTSDDVPYDQRILDLINKLGAKDPAKRPTAQKALDEARAIDEDIKTEKIVEDVIQKIMQDVIQIQIEKDVAKRARFLTWVRSLKNDANFKVQQLQQVLKRERQENKRLKQEMLREKALIEEKERKKIEKHEQEQEKWQQEKALAEQERDQAIIDRNRQI